jgi:hypothetical protein
MKPTFVLLLAVVALVGATGAAGAAVPQSGTQILAVGDGERPGGQSVDAGDQSVHSGGQSAAPPWPGGETTTRNDETEDDGDETETEDEAATQEDDQTGDDAAAENDTDEETTSVSPGQQLAGAVGAQAASVQGELWNRTLSDRLANATTADQRAEVIDDETETIETYVETLEGVRANVTGAWESGEMAEGEYRATLSGFVVRAHTVERRARRTARAAERLPAGVRADHDVNVTHIRTLAERAHDLYQFEDPIAQAVANETLGNQSALVGVPPEGQRTNGTRTGA